MPQYSHTSPWGSFTLFHFCFSDAIDLTHVWHTNTFLFFQDQHHVIQSFWWSSWTVINLICALYTGGYSSVIQYLCRTSRVNYTYKSINLRMLHGQLKHTHTWQGFISAETGVSMFFFLHRNYVCPHSHILGAERSVAGGGHHGQTVLHHSISHPAGQE